MSELRQAAQAVVDRWDTPLWKDAPHTAEFIDRLRVALARSGQAASGSSQGARWHAGWLVSNSEGDEEFANNESALAGRHYKGGSPLVLTASFERSDEARTRHGIKLWSPLARLKDDEDLELYVRARIEAEWVGQPEAPTAAPLVPEGFKLLKDTTYEERSWPEDMPHENGYYSCTCVECLRTFTGHKRRVVCKACAHPPARSVAAPLTDERIKSEACKAFNMNWYDLPSGIVPLARVIEAIARSGAGSEDAKPDRSEES